MQLDQTGALVRTLCPAGQSATLSLSNRGKSNLLTFSADQCQACPFQTQDQCPAHPYKKQLYYGFSIYRKRVVSNWRIRRFQACKEEAQALRPAIKATVFQVKYSLNHGKVRVRGLFRTARTLIHAAIGVNLCQTHRYGNNLMQG
jgi:hypothetical protein